MEQYQFTVQPKANPANQRLLPNIVDELAIKEPNGTWVEIPVLRTSYDAGFRPVTFKALANAVNGLAHLLETQLGRGQDFPTLAYMGPSDPRTPMLIYAGIKAGFKLFLTSPRNSLAAHVNLFEKLDCYTIVTVSPQPPFVAPLLQILPNAKVVSIPGIDELLSNDYPHYQYNKTWEEAKHEPIVCLHTSGSTGLPKPIVYTHEFVAAAINVSQLQPPNGYDLLNTLMCGNRGVLFLPLFHIAGIHLATYSTLMNRDTLIFPLSSAPPTGASLGAILKNTSADWAIIAPMHAEDIAKDPVLLDTVASRLKLLISCGGSVPRNTGNAITKHVHFRNYMGSSECSGYPHLVPESTWSGDDWEYVRFHPHMHAEFQERGEGLYELVMQKNEEHKEWQPPFKIFPHFQHFLTNDLYRPHPSISSLWAPAGRADDIIVLLNGEKTNPTSFEGAVATSPMVNSALVFGNGKPEAGILIEVAPEKQIETATVDARTRLAGEIYPVIAEANSVTPAHAQIAKSHIIFASPDKPFLRAGKGTVQRQLTLKAYDEAINALYDSVDGHLDVHGYQERSISHSHTGPALEQAIFQALRDVTSVSIRDPDQDFFSGGLDSLQALRLVRCLRAQLKTPDIEPSLIYAYPSVHSLAEKLGQPSDISQTNLFTHLSDSTEATFAKHSAYFDILSSCINKSVPDLAVETPSSHVILLTGSTGFIGTHLLDTLLTYKSISHIYCLNRRSVDYQLNQFSPRITHLVSDLTDPTHLGLPLTAYENIISSVTLIIHGAWPVNFAQPLAHFQKAVAGTTHLLLFATRAVQKPSFLYLSSIASVMNFKHHSTVVPAAIIESSGAAALGYGQSKQVAERLVNKAVQEYGVRAGIVRLGQVAGSRKVGGAGFNSREWFPTLIRASKQLGCLPQDLGAKANTIDWIPVDEVAEIVCELAMKVVLHTEARSNAIAEVFNVVNTHSNITWVEALSGVKDIMGDVEIVEGSEWLDRLRKSADAIIKANREGPQEKPSQNPALLLEDFYHGLFKEKHLLTLDTRSAIAASKTLRELQNINAGMLNTWVQNILTRDRD